MSPSMDAGTALRRLAEARVVRMATVGPGGRPHVVPSVFALQGRTLYWAVDDKPKRSARLRRLENIATNPNVEVVADYFEEDWGRLWWVRASGPARMVEPGQEHARAIALLRGKYPQYEDQPPAGPVVAVALVRISGWWASPPI
jgi:PPOX class probable F420-dependent enzyme